MSRAAPLAVLLALLVAPSIAPSIASAQYVDLTRPDPIAAQLTDVRLSLHAERREAGVVLALGGLLSVIGGGTLAGIGAAGAGHGDPFWLAFGIGSAGWGAVNAALAIGMLDFGDGGRASIEAERALRGEELARARERELRRQLDSATMFAVNFGLDVFYVATGVLLFFLADRLESAEEQQMLRGYAISQVAQGTFLFAFDLVEWLASTRRADRIAEVDIPSF
jgi:hypothetical protein